MQTSYRQLCHGLILCGLIFFGICRKSGETHFYIRVFFLEVIKDILSSTFLSRSSLTALWSGNVVDTLGLS